MSTMKTHLLAVILGAFALQSRLAHSLVVKDISVRQITGHGTFLNSSQNANNSFTPALTPPPGEEDSVAIVTLPANSSIEVDIDDSVSSLSSDLDARRLPQDLVTYGNYRVMFCNSTQPNSSASQIVQALDRIHENLPTVQKEVILGSRGNHGFIDLFRSNSNIKKISDIYWKIAQGEKVSVGTFKRKQPPTIMCVDPNTPRPGLKYYQQLVDFCAPASQNGGLWVENYANVIGLCPGVLATSPSPDQEYCPSMFGDRLTPNTDWLGRNLEAIILHELVHIYLGTASLEPETMKVGDATKLSASDAILNAETYAFFYSSVVAVCRWWASNG